MSTGSLRRPLFAYVVVLTVLFSLAAATIASFGLVRSSKRAYRRVVQVQLEGLAQGNSPGAIQGALGQAHLPSGVQVGWVDSSSTALGLDLPRARLIWGGRHDDLSWVAARCELVPEESYLVARIASAAPMSIAFLEISRILPLLLLAALVAGALLTLVLGRLLLPQLSTLAALAQEAGPGDAEMIPTDAPHEVAEVARRFRQTTRQLRLERDRLAAQRDELAKMQEGLVRASKLASVGRLAAGIAHEIGNPLAAVRGYLSLLQSGLDPAQQQDVLGRSQKELGRIHETIKKLLTYARRGEETVEPPQPFASGKVIEEAIGLVRGHPALRVVRIDHTGAEPGAPDAIGHPGRLNQVLVNLLLNAGQAMEGTPNPEITVVTRATDGWLEIMVSDNGPGIPRDRLPLIFDPFFTTKAPGEGTGLGLAVSRALMEAMGGDLQASSEEGRGASFTVRLRRAPPAASP